MKRIISLAIAAVIVVACKAVTPIATTICDDLAHGDEALIEQYAAANGLPVYVVRAIYIAACGPFESDKTQARAAGLDAAMHARSYLATDGGAP